MVSANDGYEVPVIDVEYARVSDFVASADNESPLGDTDQTCPGPDGTVTEQPDGWPAAVDNCPNLSNPDQRDGNNNGIGDDCEDSDADTIPDACDNCPFVSNQRQNDDDNDGIGNECDSDTDSGCLLAPDSIAGRQASNRGGPAALALLLVTAFGAAMFRRRRRK